MGNGAKNDSRWSQDASSLATPPRNAPTEQGTHVFHRQLGLFDATMLVAGTMIGSGIFIVSAEISREVGGSGWLMLVWVLTGIMTVIGALSYAELAGMMPHAGGQYVFLRDAFSSLWGFLYGWTMFLVVQTGFIAAVAVAFAKFLGVLVPQLGTNHVILSLPMAANKTFTVSAGQCVAVCVIVFLSLWNCLGIREGKWVQNLFTVAKTAALIALIAIGLTVASNSEAIQANTKAPWSGIEKADKFQETLGVVPAGLRQSANVTALIVLMVLGGAMTGSLFSADAWNNVTFAAAEVKNPHRNLPRSLALGTSLVIILYLLANLSYLSVLPIEGTKDGSTPFERGIAHARDDRVAAAVMEQPFPGWGPAFMAIAVMISTFGCVNGLSLMGARLYYAMAQDRLFFRIAGRLNGRGVPAAGLMLQGLWAILLAFSGSYSDLLDYSMFAALVFYALTVGGLFILRRKLPNIERPYRAFGYPVVPAVYMLLCLIIALDLLLVKPLFAWASLIIVLSGIPVYLFWRSRARRALA
jgi:APA family basic amino acid/polyamine antiporter